MVLRGLLLLLLLRWRLFDGPLDDGDVDSAGLLGGLALVDVELHLVALPGEVAQVAIASVQRDLQVGQAVQAVQDAPGEAAGTLGAILR